MSTSKVLQKAKIIEIIGSTIRIAHPDVSGYTKTSASPIAAGGTALTVLDNNNFADNDWFVIGAIGDNKTEEDDVNGAVTRGSSLTITNTLKFGHEIDAPVTKIFERGIKIYGAATDGGAGTLIASVDAITSPIADAVMIQWNKKYTEYTLISTDTAYAYYYVQFTDGTTSGAASDYVVATGLPENSVEKLIANALDISNTDISAKITREMCVRWANAAQDYIAHFTYDDPRTMSKEKMDWDFEIDYDESIALTENENKFSLSDLALKYPNTDKSVISVRLGNSKPLIKMSVQDYDKLLEDISRTAVATEATAGAITLTVDSNVEFADSGTLYVGGDAITYTGKTGTTIFTGIPASGTGSITETHAVDASVWQGVNPDIPTKYYIDRGYIYFNCPVDEDYVGYLIKIRFFKKLTALSEASDTTDVTFYDIMPLFIASRIELRKGKLDRSQYFMQEFTTELLNNASQNDVPLTDVTTYYDYDLSVT
jgi:hypothetical protein